ncbi:hypothetical protein AB0K05_24745 [Nonomuraea sp. NPDC049486]|uniref:hypothetical protein n=1 Tax=Nonomuraea sp. NPDC049486 TaxID=3155773 RepID=UPI0034208E9D
MATSERRSAAARLAAHASWAQTTDRKARTRNATQASPVSLAYWVDRLRGEREYASEDDLHAAARNALSAEMSRRALAGADARKSRQAGRPGRAA